MGNPTFLDSTLYPFRYYSESVPANTSTQITTTLRTELTALSWTEPVTKTFRSPADAAGRYMTLVVAEPAANRWNMALYDSSGISICSRSLYINSGSPTTVEYYTGKAHVLVNSNSGSGYWVYVFLLDTFPDDPRFLEHPAVGGGSFDSAGGYDGRGFFDYVFAVDNAVAQSAARIKGLITMNGTQYIYRMASGRYLYVPAWTYQLVGGAGFPNYVWTGKFPQALMGPVTPVLGTDWVIPITYAASATFRATSVVNSGGTYYRLFMRKA